MSLWFVKDVSIEPCTEFEGKPRSQFVLDVDTNSKTLHTNTVSQLLAFLIYVLTGLISGIDCKYKWWIHFQYVHTMFYKILLGKGDKYGKKSRKLEVSIWIFRQSFSEHLAAADTRLTVWRHFVLMN